MSYNSNPLSETEWDVIAASPVSRKLCQDMADLLIRTNYKEGWKFVRNNLDPLWSKYLWQYAAYLKDLKN